MLGFLTLSELITYILKIGISLSISTGVMFNPAYQERTTPQQDYIQTETHRYIPNFEYSSTEWTKTFTLRKVK